MHDKFNNKYRIPSARLKGHDYGAHGVYFVTICTKDMISYFGEIVGNDQEIAHFLSVIGRIAYCFWEEIPKHYPFIELDQFVVMPNHIHGILFFNRPEKDDWITNSFGSQSQNLGAVIRGYKSSVKRYANEHDILFEWQPRYYDRIVRDDMELERVREYITRNPEKWGSDRYNSNRDP